MKAILLLFSAIVFSASLPCLSTADDLFETTVMPDGSGPIATEEKTFARIKAMWRW